MRFTRTLCLAFLAATVCASGLAHAEGTPYDENAPAPKPAVKRKKPAVPAPVTPAAPIPYAPANPLSADMTKALTPDAPQKLEPQALEPLPPPVAISPAPLPVQPIEAPPPPVRAAAAALHQISLKCETQVSEGKRAVSKGVFYIDLFPSPVFPDEHADFKFLRVDPAHQSLIRQSVCLDTGCSATVTGSSYYLVSRTTKRGSALRLTLDRSTGAFYGEEINSPRIGKDSHRAESGYCAPQTLPARLF